MFHPLNLFLALRHLSSQRKRHGFLSLISWVSLLGIAIGVATLTVVTAIANGFAQSLLERSLQNFAHLRIEHQQPLRHWQPLAQQLASDPALRSITPYIEGRGMLVHGEKHAGVLIYGIDPESDARSHGTTAAALASGVVLGDGLALQLAAMVGDRIKLLLPAQQGQRARIVALQVADTVDSGINDYDRRLLLMPRQQASRLLGLEDAISGLRISLYDPFQATEKAAIWRQELGGYYRIRDWRFAQRNLFRAIHGQKQVLFIVLSLIIAVAAFNIVSALLMMVIERRSEIAVLQTMGHNPMAILRLFLLQGSLIGLLGSSSGGALGWLLSQLAGPALKWLERWQQKPLLADDIYAVSSFEAVVQYGELGLIMALAFGLCLIACLYPALLASRADPIHNLRP